MFGIFTIDVGVGVVTKLSPARWTSNRIGAGGALFTIVCVVVEYASKNVAVGVAAELPGGPLAPPPARMIRTGICKQARVETITRNSHTLDLV